MTCEELLSKSINWLKNNMDEFDKIADLYKLRTGKTLCGSDEEIVAELYSFSLRSSWRKFALPWGLKAIFDEFYLSTAPRKDELAVFLYGLVCKDAMSTDNARRILYDYEKWDKEEPRSRYYVYDGVKFAHTAVAEEVLPVAV